MTMKRTDIKAGVIYASKSSYGPPGIVVFLEDGAAGLYERQRHGAGILKVAENKYTKAQRGSGWSTATRGYAAIVARGVTPAEALGLLSTIDPARELEHFKAAGHPSVEGLEFGIRYTLTDISGLYADEKAAYDAKEAAEQAARRRKAEADRAASARRRSIAEALSTYGITAKDNAAGKIELSLDEAEKVLGKIRLAPSRAESSDET